MSAQDLPENINHVWSALCIEECIRQGIRTFCIAPGSRSTPLTVAAVRHPQTDVRMMVDERGAAFHALGYARAAGDPAVLICSSGTAAANYFPAVIEAAQDMLPMLIFSADRPPELRDTGANQTVDQVHLFGHYTRPFKDIPPPTEDIPPGWIKRVVADAVNRSRRPYHAGPVHLNFMFREPLAPVKAPVSAEYVKAVKTCNNGKAAVLHASPATGALPEELTASLTRINRGVIIAGRLQSLREAESVRKLAEHLGWPLLADITSGCRLKSSPVLLPYADLLLNNASFAAFLKEKPILHFGGQWVSKRLMQTLQHHNGPYWQITPFDKRIDPANAVTHKIITHIESASSQLIQQLPSRKPYDISPLKQKHQAISRILKTWDAETGEIDELFIARSVIRSKPNALYIASSMPVRDMDMAAPPLDQPVPVAANRGASGIDGTIASAIGFSRGLKKPLTLLTGDLAFLHDMNSLMQLKDHPYPITIVLVNNRGGAIFNYLPIASFNHLLTPWFNTPHQYSFKAAAEQFGLSYTHVRNRPTLIDVLENVPSGHRLIEVDINPEFNVQRHKDLYERIRAL